ncbi:hypothetical protein HDE_04877 [Halotydeus destructor]|nr:hypothetical protein HDE_04877 [Halotydeus destructor]
MIPWALIKNASHYILCNWLIALSLCASISIYGSKLSYHISSPAANSSDPVRVENGTESDGFDFVSKYKPFYISCVSAFLVIAVTGIYSALMNNVKPVIIALVSQAVLCALGAINVALLDEPPFYLLLEALPLVCFGASFKRFKTMATGTPSLIAQNINLRLLKWIVSITLIISLIPNIAKFVDMVQDLVQSLNGDYSWAKVYEIGYNIFLSSSIALLAAGVWGALNANVRLIYAVIIDEGVMVMSDIANVAVLDRSPLAAALQLIPLAFALTYVRSIKKCQLKPLEELSKLADKALDLIPTDVLSTVPLTDALPKISIIPKLGSD